MEPSADTAALYDRVAVLDNLGGDEELLKEIARIFLAGYQQEVDRMRAALATGDTATLCRLVHAMKGSIGNFGAQAGIDAAIAVERKAHEKQPDGIDAEFARFAELVERLADALRGEAGTA